MAFKLFGGTIRSCFQASLTRMIRRNLSITCRGKDITEEDLFRYTNGRFLSAEEDQCRRRYLKFNVQKLCDVAAELGDPSPVVHIDKMEGGFSKALLLKRKDGQEYIAKFPFPNAGPAFYTTASELAILQLIKSTTTVPVPHVLAWNTSSSNPVGAEYIIMEKAPGVQLYHSWDMIGGDDRLALIKQLTELEKELSSIRFPAFGCPYAANTVPEPDSILLHSSDGLAPLYGIGRSCDRSWDMKLGTSNHDLPQSLNFGPWKSLSEYGKALTEREIFKLQTQSATRPYRSCFSDIDDDIAILQKAANLMDQLESCPLLQQTSRPALWHTDLHMGNIFISDTKPSEITSLIDWQSISVLPLFLQARWPVFLEPLDNYQTGFVQPKLPSNFESMDEEDKAMATYKFKQASRTKAYETSTFLLHRDAHNAMNVPRVLRELFLRCGDVFDEGVEPLRACLIEISRSWENLKLPGACPFQFSHDEINAHDIAFVKYEEFHDVQKFALRYLDTDADGWIAPIIDFDEKLAQNRALFDYYLKNMAGGTNREKLLRIWPFPDSIE